MRTAVPIVLVAGGGGDRIEPLALALVRAILVDAISRFWTSVEQQVRTLVNV